MMMDTLLGIGLMFFLMGGGCMLFAFAYHVYKDAKR